MSTIENLVDGWRLDGSPMGVDSGRGTRLLEVLAGTTGDQDARRELVAAVEKLVNTDVPLRTILTRLRDLIGMRLKAMGGEPTGDAAPADAKAYAESLRSPGPAQISARVPLREARRTEVESSWSSAPSLDFPGVADVSEAKRFANSITR